MKSRDQNGSIRDFYSCEIFDDSKNFQQWPRTCTLTFPFCTKVSIYWKLQNCHSHISTFTTMTFTSDCFLHCVMLSLDGVESCVAPTYVVWFPVHALMKPTPSCNWDVTFAVTQTLCHLLPTELHLGEWLQVQRWDSQSWMNGLFRE